MFYNSQYGFKKEHSTEVTALELVHKLIIEINKANTLINIYF